MNIATNMGVLLNVPMPDNATKLFPYLILHRRPNTTTVAPSNNTETTEVTPSNTTTTPSNLITDVSLNGDSSITDISSSDSSITDISSSNSSITDISSSDSSISDISSSDSSITDISSSDSSITDVSSETAPSESDVNPSPASSKTGHIPKDTPSNRPTSAGLANTTLLNTTPALKARNSGLTPLVDHSSDEEERGNGLFHKSCKEERGKLEENRGIHISGKTSVGEKVDEDNRVLPLEDDEGGGGLNLLYHDHVYEYIEHYLHSKSNMDVCSIVQVCHVMSVLHENKFARDLLHVFLKPRFLQNPSRVGKQLARLSRNLNYLIRKCHATAGTEKLGQNCARLIVELWQ